MEEEEEGRQARSRGYEQVTLSARQWDISDYVFCIGRELQRRLVPGPARAPSETRGSRFETKRGEGSRGRGTDEDGIIIEWREAEAARYRISTRSCATIFFSSD